MPRLAGLTHAGILAGTGGVAPGRAQHFAPGSFRPGLDGDAGRNLMNIKESGCTEAETFRLCSKGFSIFN